MFGRLAGYEDVNDAERLRCDPAMRWVVGDRAISRFAASASQMGRFKIGAKVVSHGRYVTFQLAKVAVPRQVFSEILSLIARLRAPPAPA